MSQTQTRLVLLTPHRVEADDADALAAALESACAPAVAALASCGTPDREDIRG